MNNADWSIPVISVTQNEAVSTVVDRFVETLQVDSSSRIESFWSSIDLTPFEPSSIELLMYYLIQEEYEHRGRDGRNVKDDYAQRFPEFIAVSRSAIRQIQSTASTVAMPRDRVTKSQIIGVSFEGVGTTPRR